MRFLKYFNEQQKEELVEKINGLNIDNDIKDKWFDIIKERIESSFFSTIPVRDGDASSGNVKEYYYIVTDDNDTKYMYKINIRDKQLLDSDLIEIYRAIEFIKVQTRIQLIMKLLNEINNRFFEKSTSKIQYIVSFYNLESHDDKAEKYKNYELSMEKKNLEKKNYYYFQAKFFKKLIDIFINAAPKAKDAIEEERKAIIEESEKTRSRIQNAQIKERIKREAELTKQLIEKYFKKITQQEAEIEKIRNKIKNIDKIDKILSESEIEIGNYTKSIIKLANLKKNEAFLKVSELDNILNGFKNIVNEKKVDTASIEIQPLVEEGQKLAEDGQKLAEEGQKLAEEGQKLAEIAFEIEEANQKIDKAKNKVKEANVIAKSDKAKNKVEVANVIAKSDKAKKEVEVAELEIISAIIKVYKLIKKKLNNDSIDEIVNDVKILAENALKLAEEAKAEAERQAANESPAELDKAATRIQSIARGKAERTKHKERQAKAKEEEEKEREREREKKIINDANQEIDKLKESAIEEIGKIRNEVNKINKIAKGSSKGSYTTSINLAIHKVDEESRKVSELDNILNGFKNIENEKEAENAIIEANKASNEIRLLAKKALKLAEIAFEIEEANQKIEKANKEVEEVEEANVIAKSDKAKNKVEEAKKAREDAIINANRIVNELTKKEILNNDSIDEIVKKVKLLAEKALKLAEKALILVEDAKAEEAAAKREAAVKIQARIRGIAARKKEAVAKKEAEEKEEKERFVTHANKLIANYQILANEKIDEVSKKAIRVNEFANIVKGSYTTRFINLAQAKIDEAFREISNLIKISSNIKEIVNQEVSSKDEANNALTLAKEANDKLLTDANKIVIPLAEEGLKLAEIAVKIEEANQEIEKADNEVENAKNFIAKSDKAKKTVEKAKKAKEEAEDEILNANKITKKEILNNDSIDEIVKKVKLLAEKALKLAKEAKAEEEAVGEETPAAAEAAPAAEAAVPINVCGYLTDVEGNLDYFQRYVDLSEILGWEDDAAKSKLRFKREDAMFVFGGDSQDKGPGDIRFTKLLLALKAEYPGRVEFIIGNRDANKLRLASELQEECIKDAAVLTDSSFPYWDAAEKRVTPQMFLDKNQVDNGGRENTAANRLRYILKHTMGADGAFERRREELSIIRNCGKEDVSDEDVVESYRNEVDPAKEEGNFMLKYLQQGKLAYVFGEHLFVHGAVSETNVGTVPGSTERIERVEKWVDALNAWCQGEVAAFESDPYSGKNGRDRKGSGLMDYGVPGGNGGATVMYSNNLDEGNGKHIALAVRKYLGASGIKSVITGHQPHGDCPLVIRSGQVTAISADTSYSKMGHNSGWGTDNRGDAVSEVLLYAGGGITVHGVLADGNKVRYQLGEEGGGDKFVGRQLSDGNWVKAKTEGAAGAAGAEYVLCLGEGFELTVSRRTEREMEALTKEDFIEPEQKSENEAASNETKYNEAELFISGILSKTEQEKAQLEEAQLEEAQPKEAKQEEAQQEKAKRQKDEEEKAKQEKAQLEKAQPEEAQLEKAKRQKDEEEKAKRQKDEEEKAKKEKAKKENTISSISNYFMKDNVDNIEKRFRKFIKEHGTDEELKFTDKDFRQIDKAVIKRAIKGLSEPARSQQPTAPKISIRTTNALIEVLGKTIKKKKNVKELFDAYNIKINSDEVDRIFNKYFKDGLKEKEIRKYINLESKDNDSENVEFIVNTFAGIGKDDLIKLFETSDIPPLNEDEINKLHEKYFKDGKFNMGKLIELYGIK